MATKKKNTCASELGRKGGLKAKRMKVGIFSPAYKKKVKTKRKAPKAGL